MTKIGMLYPRNRKGGDDMTTEENAKAERGRAVRFSDALDRSYFEQLASERAFIA